MPSAVYVHANEPPAGKLGAWAIQLFISNFKSALYNGFVALMTLLADATATADNVRQLTTGSGDSRSQVIQIYKQIILPRGRVRWSFHPRRTDDKRGVRNSDDVSMAAVER